MKRVMIVLVLAAFALGAGAAPVGAGKARVRATASSWDPDFKHVKKKTKVIWKNPSSVFHNVTAYGGGWSKSSSLSPGAKTAKRFKRNGTFRYYCTIHGSVSNGKCSGMCGVIHVAPQAP